MFCSALARLFSSRRRPLNIKASPQRHRFTPRLDALEDRTVPSTLTVLNNLDHGSGSLRDTIAAAHSGDIIDFANSVHAITLTTGELEISKNLDIEGPGAALLTISGGDLSRVFHIEIGNSVTLANLTIADGQASGPLPASMVGVFSGTGTGAGGGGGILNEAGARLTLNNDTVSDNQAIHGPSPLAFTVVGGGLLNLGTATVQGCTFLDNHAEGGNALDNIGGSAGGAIDNFGGPGGGATFTAANCAFSNNSAVAAGGGDFFGIGGALEFNAGLNLYDPTQAQASTLGATLTNCTFVNNLATGGPNAIADGGAIVMEGVGLKMTLVGCTINGNRSVGGGGGDGITTGDSEAVGGGIVSAAGTLNIVGCTVTNNLALAGNNGIISDGDTLASGAFGGGIENNFDNVLNISNSFIANNTAQGGATDQGPGGDALGGGISNSPSATMVMTNCIVASNSAIAGQGGPGVNTQLGSAQAGFAFGGGVDTSRSSTATIRSSTITGNQAVGGAGGGSNNGGEGLGGGLGVGWGTLVGFSPDDSQLTLLNSVVSNNQAVGGAAGLCASGGTALGGGLAIDPGCIVTVNNSKIQYNTANGSQSSVGQANGGGGIDNAGTLTLTNSSLAGNQAITTAGNDVLGGGLLNNQGKATIEGTTFSGNAALGGGSSSFFSGSAGGGIDNYEGASLSIDNSTFQNNEAISAGDASGDFFYATGGAIEEDAGVINNNPSTSTVTNSTFSNNLATGGFGVIGQGGAIIIQSANTSTPGLVTMNVVDCVVTGNRAVGGGGGDGVTSGDSQGIGGGIYTYGGAIMNITSCTIGSNEALGGSGALINSNDPYAGAGFGGGIENNFNCTLNISDSVITNNVTNGGATLAGPGSIAVGGGISNSPHATMTMTNCVVTNNSAIAGHGGPGVNTALGSVQAGFAFGGGVDTSNNGSSATIIDSLISGNQAIGSVGGGGNTGGNGYGGGLSVGFVTLFGMTDGSQLTVIDSIVSGNLAQGGTGGAGANGGDGLGGGLYVAATGSATVTDSVITGNDADGGAKGKGSHVGQGYGGGVAYVGSFIKDALTVIDHNDATTSGDNLYEQP
jgi:fibronectin-binding autotransporter adhesin